MLNDASGDKNEPVNVNHTLVMDHYIKIVLLILFCFFIITYNYILFPK